MGPLVDSQSTETRTTKDAVQLRSRNWLLRVYATLAEQRADSETVDVRTDVGASKFIAEYYLQNKPLVVPQLAAEWPATRRWGKEYFMSLAPMSVEVMLRRSEAPVHEWNTGRTLRTEMGWHDYVSLVYSGKVTNNYYLVSRNRFFERGTSQRLLQDIVCPPYVHIVDPREVKLWFGPAGTWTPLHHDDRNNLIVQVIGRKRVRLYAPHFAPCMAETRPFYAEWDPDRDDGAMASYQMNVTGFAVDLAPGDGLFIPVGWWHAVEALDVSVTCAFTDFGCVNQYGQP